MAAVLLVLTIAYGYPFDGRYYISLGPKGTLSFHHRGWFGRDKSNQIELVKHRWWWESDDGWRPVNTPFVSPYNGFSDLVLDSNGSIFFQSVKYPDTRFALRVYYPSAENYEDSNVPLENRHPWWQIQREGGEWEYYHEEDVQPDGEAGD